MMILIDIALWVLGSVWVTLGAYIIVTEMAVDEDDLDSY